MKKLSVIFLLFFFVSLQAQKGECGMWMPNTIKQVEGDMQGMGMSVSADQIWNNEKPSIKDAVVQFGGGCTAEIMSDKGLVFTNHHCGYDAIQKLSTLEHNYLQDGFWANSFEEELPAPGLSVTFIDDIVEVTNQVLDGVNDKMSAKERQSTIDKNINKLKKSTPQDRFHTFSIKPFFKGNKYYMIKKTTFYDVRLVGTPPASLGKFGGDTDNWEWPRHTADFSVFRVYANQKNEPAMYAPNNKPYKPKYFFKVNIEDLKPEDFTMVIGFPGRTNEYLTSYAVKQIQDVRDPARVAVREITLGIMDKKMAKDKALKLKLASKHAQLANYWKFWIGESQGLKKFKAVEAKEKFEKDFTEKLNSNPEWKQKYGDILPRLKKLYGQLQPYLTVQDYTSEIFGRNVELPGIVMIAGMLDQQSKARGEAFYKMVKDRYKDYLLNNVMNNFDKNTDKEIFANLLDFYVKNVDSKYLSPELREVLKKKTPQELVNEIYQKSSLTTKEGLDKLFSKETAKEFSEALHKDPAYELLNSQKEWIDKNVSNPVNKINTEINSLMSKYLKAQMDVYKDKAFYPDANFTMRVSYGRVKGFHPKDAVFYEPFTHGYGILEKYKPGDPEFDLPKKVVELLEKKDYGRYASKDGTLITDFLATNHITGGNSGSPILNGRGEHIGLAFDGVWQGIMEDIYYRPEVARSIHVKDNYVLWVIDKVGNCKHIINELTIIDHSKDVKPVKKDVKKKKRKKFLGIF